MPRARTLHEKVKAIATTAEWMAAWGGWESLNERATPALRRAIEAAYEALQIISEGHQRNQICALLASQAELYNTATPERCESVRSFIRSTKEGDEFSFEPGPGEASDATIAEALAAWRRKPGSRSRGAPDKWKATAKLLKESGFGVVDPDALRLNWQRRTK